MAMRYTFHISPPQLNNILHWTTFPAQHTIPHLVSFHILHTTRSHITWRDVDSVVWNLVRCECFAMPDVGCCALFILMWLWCRIRAIWCDATGDVTEEVLWNVVMRCGLMGVIHVEYGGVVCCDARCKMWLRTTEWCGMVWRHIRLPPWRCHAECWLKCSERCGVVWNVCCGIVMCNLYLNVVMCGGMWAWCGLVRRDVVEWSDVNYGAMWNVVWCVGEMWCDVECCNFRHGATEMQNMRCGIWRGVEYGVLVCGMLLNCKMRKVTMWCGDEECQAYAMCCVIFVWCQTWKWFNVLSDVVV